MTSYPSRNVALDDVCREITVGHVGPMADKYVPEGIPFLRSQNVRPFKFDPSELKFISPEFHRKLKKSALRPNDVVITRTGANTGQCCIIPKELTEANCADLVILRPSEDLDPRYLMYLLNSPFGRASINGDLAGAAQPHFNVGSAKRFRATLPDLPTQRKIAGILSAYDDLIENNLRRIRILEEMAQSLYREWFVHFRFPGHEGVRMVDSPLGRIPEGWEVKKLGDVLELNYGEALKEADRKGGDFPVFASSGIVGYHDTALTCGPGIVVGRKGNVGSVFWSNQDFYVIDTAYFVTSALPLRFLFYVLPTLNFINSDAAVPGLSRNQAYTLEVAVPQEKILKQFCELAETFEAKADALKRRNQNLRQTRDLLLPKLLSGQMALPVSETVKVEHPTPARASRPAKPTPVQEKPVPRPNASTPDSPPSIDDIARKDVLCAIRKLFSDGWWRDRETALKELSLALGYRRLGPHLREVLSTDLLTAVRRGILTSEGGEYTLGFRTLTDLPRDVLKDRFLSAIGRGWITRDDAIRAFARSLGFARTGDQIDQTARSLINGLIREGRLEAGSDDGIRRIQVR